MSEPLNAIVTCPPDRLSAAIGENNTTKSVQGEMLDGLSVGHACSHPCVNVIIQLNGCGHAYPHAHPGAREDEALPCPLGLSFVWIKVLAMLGLVSNQVISYKRLAQQFLELCGIKKTPEAMRGIVFRLGEHGFLHHRQARHGTIRGVWITLQPERLCPHMPVPRISREGMQHGIPQNMHALPLDKIGRIEDSTISCCTHAFSALSSFTAEDMAFHWPELVRMGFGTKQVDQIVSRLRQMNKDPAGVLQGLTHAEWELAHGCMRDRHGNEVSSPQNWVFKILATQGYYPRPKGYVSPEEQAEKDALEESRRLEEISKKRVEEARATWFEGLSMEDRQGIFGADHKLCTPNHPKVRVYFKQHVWENLSSQTPEGCHE